MSGVRESERFGLSGLPFSGACALAAACLVELGDAGPAQDLLRRGEAAASVANHLYSKVPLAIARGRLLTLYGEITEVVRVMEPIVAICREHNFVGQTMRALTVLGDAYAAAGRASEAVPLVQEAIQLQESAAAFVDRALWVRTLGEAYRQAGQLGEAERTAHTALEFARRNGEQANEAWTRFLFGEIAADREDQEAARRHLEQARELAAGLGMRPLVAQCHFRLAAVARRGGAKDEARGHLQTATQMFAEMDMHAALAKARAQAAKPGEGLAE